MPSREGTVLKLVAFDMDGTLVEVSSSWAFVHEHLGLSNAEGLRQFMEGTIDDLEFIRSDVRLWKSVRPGISVFDLEEILAEVPLMPGAPDLMRGLRERGILTAIVSGGIDLLARRIGRELQMDYVLANGIRTDAAGHLTEEGILRVPIKKKDEVLAGIQEQLGVRPEETASVGNSEIDVALFRRSRVGIAFKPEDQTVRDAATEVLSAVDHDLTHVLRILDTFPAD